MHDPPLLILLPSLLFSILSSFIYSEVVDGGRGNGMVGWICGMMQSTAIYTLVSFSRPSSPSSNDGRSGVKETKGVKKDAKQNPGSMSHIQKEKT